MDWTSLGSCCAVSLSSSSAETRASATVATQEEASAAESNGGQTSHGVSSRAEEADAALLTWAAPSDTISSRRRRQSLNRVKVSHNLFAGSVRKHPWKGLFSNCELECFGPLLIDSKRISASEKEYMQPVSRCILHFFTFTRLLLETTSWLRL